MLKRTRAFSDLLTGVRRGGGGVGGVKIFNDISLPAPKINTLTDCKVCAEGVPDLALPHLSPIGVGGRVLHIYVPSLWLHLLQGV